MNPTVLAITGASGAAYGVRLLERLLAAKASVRLTISPPATQVIEEELGRKVDLDRFCLPDLLGETGPPDDEICGKAPGPDSRQDDESDVVYHHYLDYRAGIASGSFLTQGMVICPCSMGSLAAIANGLSSNLIHRAAHVHLKERRKLIVVPRETPLSGIHLDNMKRLSDAGAVILPAMPGFYHRPTSVGQIVDFLVDRILDQLQMTVSGTKRWGIENSRSPE